MRKQLVPVVVVAFLVGGLAMAGQKFADQVFIDTSGRFASGNLGAVRNSADNVQRIGCLLSATNTGAVQGSCIAKNAQGVMASCITTVQGQIETMRSISDSSFVAFTWDSNGFCVNVWVEHSSEYEPKR